MQCCIFRDQIFQVSAMLRNPSVSEIRFCLTTVACIHPFILSCSTEMCQLVFLDKLQGLANFSQQKPSLLLTTRPNLPLFVRPLICCWLLESVSKYSATYWCHVGFSWKHWSRVLAAAEQVAWTELSFIPAMTRLVFSPAMEHGKRLGLTTADTLSKQRNQPPPNPNWSALGCHAKRTHGRFWERRAFIRAGIRRMLVLGN